MIRLDGVGKTYDDGTVAVEALDLDVPRGAVVTLVGPSGCGKSTTLKMVNRLIEPTHGRIFLDGTDVTDADPVELRRGIGYVIQQVGLFPHQTIATNVATVPSLLGWSKDKARGRALELMDLVGLDPAVYADRFPHQLSGGQRQRVGVARALAADPPVLLMDEPFGAVDPVVRARLQDEFLRLQRELDKTVLLVTHDIDEAVKMGDKVAVFAAGGRLAQYDEPAAILGAPADDFVSEFVGGSRGLRRLSVTRIDPSYLEPMDGVSASALAGTVDVDATLEEVLALVMREDKEMVGVTRGAKFLGVLSPNGVHRMLRASVAAAHSRDREREQG
jgi:osmoprotectant transport system ATP-binding protein